MSETKGLGHYLCWQSGDDQSTAKEFFASAFPGRAACLMAKYLDSEQSESPDSREIAVKDHKGDIRIIKVVRREVIQYQAVKG